MSNNQGDKAMKITVIDDSNGKQIAFSPWTEGPGMAGPLWQCYAWRGSLNTTTVYVRSQIRRNTDGSLSVAYAWSHVAVDAQNKCTTAQGESFNLEDAKAAVIDSILGRTPA